MTRGKVTAAQVVDDALARIRERDPQLNSFTDVVADRARDRARAVDACEDERPARRRTLRGQEPVRRERPADARGLEDQPRARARADKDQPLIERLEAAGAVLVGALNMGEYAYDFTGENVHDGNARNPHDLTRMTGGSSSGSGGAVAGGLVPLSLGSDTNGSIRVPSSFCGLFGLKPTYGRLTPRALVPVRRQPRPSRAARAHAARPRARLRRDAGTGRRRPGVHRPRRRARDACAGRAASTDCASRSRADISAKARFRKPSPRVDRVAKALGASAEIEIPEAARARAAAYVITATEGASLHLERLRTRAADFDPAVRDRLIAGAMVPTPLYHQAQKFRRWYRAEVLKLFETVDAILAPATPCTAPAIGQKTFVLDGVELPVRPNIGIYTQPISFIGLPVAPCRCRSIRCRSACR